MRDRRSVDYGVIGRFGIMCMFGQSNSVVSTWDNTPRDCISRHRVLLSEYRKLNTKPAPFTSPYPELPPVLPSEIVNRAKNEIARFRNRKVLRAEENSFMSDWRRRVTGEE